MLRLPGVQSRPSLSSPFLILAGRVFRGLLEKPQCGRDAIQRFPNVLAKPHPANLLLVDAGVGADVGQHDTGLEKHLVFGITHVRTAQGFQQGSDIAD